MRQSGLQENDFTAHDYADRAEHDVERADHGDRRVDDGGRAGFVGRRQLGVDRQPIELVAEGAGLYSPPVRPFSGALCIALAILYTE